MDIKQFKRTLFFLSFLIILSLANSQASTFEVVIVTRGVQSLLQEREIEIRNIIKDSDTLFVPRNGYISLLDEYSNIFEFYGEKKIYLDTLKGSSLLNSNYPNIGTLFSLKPPSSRIHDDSAPIIELFHPFFFSKNIEIKDTIFVNWRNRRVLNGKFVVKIINEYDDLIFREEVKSNQIVIKFTKDIIVQEIRLILVVEYLGMEKQIKSEEKFITFNNNQLRRHDVTSMPNSAAGNLHMALFLESKGFINEALGFYQKASDLSQEILEYKIFLSNFKSRWSL